MTHFARWSSHTWSLGCLWLRPTQVDPLINNVSNRAANENSPQCILDFETTGKCLVTRSGELSCEHSSLLVLRHKPLSNASRREVCKGSGTNNVVSTLSRYSLRSFKVFFPSSISLFHKWLTRQNTKCFHMLWKQMFQFLGRFIFRLRKISKYEQPTQKRNSPVQPKRPETRNPFKQRQESHG